MPPDHPQKADDPSRIGPLPVPELPDNPGARAGLHGVAAHLHLLLTALALEADRFREMLSLLKDIDERFIDAEMRAADIFSKAAILEQDFRDIASRSKLARYDSRDVVSRSKSQQT